MLHFITLSSLSTTNSTRPFLASELGSTSSAGTAVVTRHTAGSPVAKNYLCGLNPHCVPGIKQIHVDSTSLFFALLTPPEASPKKGEKYGVVTIQERTNNKDDAIEEDAAMGVRESSGEV
ncbi:hypothetical protein Tco_0045970 [Tanacetum coccineum]